MAAQRLLAQKVKGKEKGRAKGVSDILRANRNKSGAYRATCPCECNPYLALGAREVGARVEQGTEGRRALLGTPGQRSSTKRQSGRYTAELTLQYTTVWIRDTVALMVRSKFETRV